MQKNKYGRTQEGSEGKDKWQRPSLDGVPSDVRNGGKNNLRSTISPLQQMCIAGNVSQDICDALIITIYKEKGNCVVCGNHQGISLLATADKVLAKIVLKRLKSSRRKSSSKPVQALGWPVHC